MAYVLQFVLVVLTIQVVDVFSKRSPFKDDVVMSETTGHLYGIETSGEFRRLHRRDIDNIKNDESRHLRLHTLEGDDVIDMELQEGSVWGKDSVLVIRRGEQTFNVPHAGDRGCHLHGRVTSHSGAVQMNRCGKMTGTIHTNDHHYDIEEIPTEAEIEDQAHTRFKVTKKKSTEEIINDEEMQHLHRMDKREIFEDVDDMEDDDDDDDDNNNNNSTHREKRGIRVVTIELAIFVDSFYVDHLVQNKGRRTANQIQNWFVEKWNVVQGVYSDPRKIGAKLTIDLKRVEIWWRDPDNYPGDDVAMNPRLAWFCANTPQGDKFDQKVLYSDSTGGEALGLAWVGDTCRVGYNCYVVRSPTKKVGVELHEMGHNIGFPHDPKFGNCVPSSGKVYNSGFMGWELTYNYLECYKKKMQRLVRRHSYKCLYKQNVFEDLTTDPAPTPAQLELPFGC